MAEMNQVDKGFNIGLELAAGIVRSIARAMPPMSALPPSGLLLLADEIASMRAPDPDDPAPVTPRDDPKPSVLDQAVHIHEVAA